MLTLNDGRSELWQWDTGRTLSVDADCSQVHFSNKVFGRSIDVDVIDSIAIIPDILLQTDKDLFAWAFVGTPENGYTKISKVFKVNKRNKPSDYVFTPPEQTTLGEILERLDDIESSQDPDAIKNAVDDYLANNPIKVEEKDPTVPEWAKQPTPPDVKIPDKLPNPHSITFTGAVNASYDGSDPVEITIPDSGGNAGFVVQPTAPEDTSVLWVDPDDDTEDGSQNGGIAVTGATVGQTVKIAAVDENGVPTAWEPTDFPSGGGRKWELIAEGTVAEEAIKVDIYKDVNGEDFELICWYLYFILEPCENNKTQHVHTKVNNKNVVQNVSANADKVRYYQSFGEVIGGYKIICAQSISNLDYNNQWSIGNFASASLEGSNAKKISLDYGNANVAGANSKYVLYGVRA